jgi:hypothetical protein
MHSQVSISARVQQARHGGRASIRIAQTGIFSYVKRSRKASWCTNQKRVDRVAPQASKTSSATSKVQTHTTTAIPIPSPAKSRPLSPLELHRAINITAHTQVGHTRTLPPPPPPWEGPPPSNSRHTSSRSRTSHAPRRMRVARVWQVLREILISPPSTCTQHVLYRYTCARAGSRRHTRTMLISSIPKRLRGENATRGGKWHTQ